MKFLRFTYILLLALICISCSKNSKLNEQIEPIKKFHTWYYFSEKSFTQIDLPQNAPKIVEKAWTETTRISSIINDEKRNVTYALVNRMGLLILDDSGNDIKLFSDSSVFDFNTADSLILSEDIPVFYLYKSSFFNEGNAKKDENELNISRPFLVEFNQNNGIFYPLVSYENLGLKKEDQITSFYWDGKTWTCSAKSLLEERVDFLYFIWEPLLPLTELSPALGSSLFQVQTVSEEKFKQLTMPSLFTDSPQELKDLLESIPKEISFYIVWKDSNGFSAKSFYNPGNEKKPLNAKACVNKKNNLIAAVFADGTTYMKNLENDKSIAFKLPLLPKGFVYGDFALTKNSLYIAWEESKFYKVGRAGFMRIELDNLFSK